MDKVKAMQTFVRIVEANSFTRAAESLDLPRASLTATLQNLERYLGAQLLQRTTRRLSLTPEGERYYATATPSWPPSTTPKPTFWASTPGACRAACASTCRARSGAPSCCRTSVSFARRFRRLT
jgi:hypothetical protein